MFDDYMFDESINKVAQLIELKIIEKPQITVNEKSAPRSGIGQLIVNGFIPSYQEAPQDLKWLVEGEGDVERDTSVSILDLLGVYKSEKNEIILYDILIKLASIKLEINFEALKMVVLFHEISHAVTHRGLDEENNIWTFFDVADQEVKEYFAQIYPYKLFEQENRRDLMSAMNRLSEIQPTIYRKYKELLNLDIKELNVELRKERNKIPEEYSNYHEALQRKWSIFFSNLTKKPNPHYLTPAERKLRDLEKALVDYMYKVEIERVDKELERDKQWLKSGTEFKITAKRIDIRSYDYSPSDNTLTIDETCKFFNLIYENISKIRSHSVSKLNKSHQFSVTIDEETFQMDFKDPFAFGFFNKVLEVLNKRYPVLVKVLKKYSF